MLEGLLDTRYAPHADWRARNLALLRLSRCPTVYLEPYCANSNGSYQRIQAALRARAAGGAAAQDDILLEYEDALVDGVVRWFGGAPPADGG